MEDESHSQEKKSEITFQLRFPVALGHGSSAAVRTCDTHVLHAKFFLFARCYSGSRRQLAGTI